MVIAQQLSSLLKGTRLRWAQDVGHMHYRNNIVAYSGNVIVSTSGSAWGEPDNGDGVRCLSLDSGAERWRYQSNGDANTVALLDEAVVGGTDLGQMFALDVNTGRLLAEARATAPLLGKPTVITSFGERFAILISANGEVWQYALGSEQFIKLGEIEGKFTSSAATDDELALDGGLIVGSDDGVIYRLTAGRFRFIADRLMAVPPRPSSSIPEHLPCLGIGSIVVIGDTAVISYIRDTYDRDPPMLAINISTGSILWYARRVKTVSKNVHDYGNARCVPIISNGMIYSTFSYNDSLHAFSLRDGKGEWMVKLDEPLFQNWASPILYGDGRIVVPRVNGFIHLVDTKKKKVTDSISVEIGRYFDPDKRGSGSQPISRGVEDKIWPSSLLVSGIASSPAVADRTLLVGSVSGQLRAYSL